MSVMMIIQAKVLNTLVTKSYAAGSRHATASTAAACGRWRFLTLQGEKTHVYDCSRYFTTQTETVQGERHLLAPNHTWEQCLKNIYCF